MIPAYLTDSRKELLVELERAGVDTGTIPGWRDEVNLKMILDNLDIINRCRVEDRTELMQSFIKGVGLEIRRDVKA